MFFKEKMLLVFAHPDDETFGTGGIIALAVKAGAEVKLICATKGEKGKLNLKRRLSEKKLGQIRTEELKNALKVFGVKPPVIFNYPDGSLDKAEEKEIVAKIIKVIRQFKPCNVVTFGPDGVSGHRDHIAISRFASKAFQIASKEKNGPKNLYWRTKSPSERKIFKMRLGSRPKTREHYKKQLIKLPYADKDLFEIDISSVVSLKLEAARQHKTQNPDIFFKYFKKMPKNFWRYETFCRVTAKMLRSVN